MQYQGVGDSRLGNCNLHGTRKSWASR